MTFQETLKNAKAHIAGAFTVGGTPDPYAAALVELAEQVKYLLNANHPAVEALCKRVLERMILP